MAAPDFWRKTTSLHPNARPWGIGNGLQIKCIGLESGRPDHSACRRLFVVTKFAHFDTWVIPCGKPGGTGLLLWVQYNANRRHAHVGHRPERHLLP